MSPQDNRTRYSKNATRYYRCNGPAPGKKKLLISTITSSAFRPPPPQTQPPFDRPLAKKQNRGKVPTKDLDSFGTAYFSPKQMNAPGRETPPRLPKELTRRAHNLLICAVEAVPATPPQNVESDDDIFRSASCNMSSCGRVAAKSALEVCLSNLPRTICIHLLAPL